MESFSLRLPSNIIFGEGKLSKLGEAAAKYAKTAVVFVDGKLSDASDIETVVKGLLEDNEIKYNIIALNGCFDEKSFEECVATVRESNAQLLIAVGDERTIDAAKAIRSIVSNNWQLADLIESAHKDLTYDTALPLIAIPSTAGSGNFVSDEIFVEIKGYKRLKAPLKNDIFVPSYTIIDPELMQHSPKETRLYSGLDAFCQLLEAYVSKGSNTFTDTLMMKGLKLLSRDLLPFINDASNVEARSNVAYASLLSGIGVANSQLTLLHGLAFAIGSRYENIPHGAICASILFASTLLNMQRVQMFDPMSVATTKYAKVGSLFSGIENSFDKHGVLLRAVTEYLMDFTKDLKVPKLSELGVDKEDFYSIVSEAKLYGNPVDLAETEIMDILEMSY